MSSSTSIFFKAQVSAFLGGVFDYIVMIALTEWGGIFYPISIVISGFLGAIVNFSINRFWSFSASGQPTSVQLPKFLVVVMGSVLLKSSGTYTLTTLGHLDYKISRLCVDTVVSIGFNFMLQKYWVFRKKSL